MIKIAFEDAAGCDIELITAIEHADYALINFLMNVASSNGYQFTLLILLLSSFD
jgi:hypothetical protein